MNPESGPSPMDEFDEYPPYYGSPCWCPIHQKKQEVVGADVTKGPDPYHIDVLACGHRTIAFGNQDEDICVLNP